MVKLNTTKPGKPAKVYPSTIERKTTVPRFELLEGRDGDIPCDIGILPRNPKRVRGLWVRNSLRWADSYKVPSGPYYVPFIDDLGRFTGHTLYKWCCDPRQLVASVISTISKRMQYYARRHNSPKVVERFSQSLLRASTYYAMSKNSWFWDRILFFSRNLEKHGKRILTLVMKFVSKVDDNKRFVYGQVSSQTNWLLFRAHVPRDKSAFIIGGEGKNLRNFAVSSPPDEWRYGMCEFAKAISLISHRW